MKKTISLIVIVVVMFSMLIVPVSAAEGTSPLDMGISLADVTSPAEVTKPEEIVEGESILQADISGDLTITAGEYVIDLNGYTWTGRLVIEGGNVTIKDTSTAKTGKIDASQITDAIDISGGAIVSLEDITIIGSHTSGDAIFASGSPNVTIKNCVLTAGKVGLDVMSLSVVVIVEDTVFADFANFKPDLPKDERNAAVELRNNAVVVLKGENKFEVNKIICRSNNHTTPIKESFVLGDGVTATFESEDAVFGIFGGENYKSNIISYSYETPADESVNDSNNDSTDDSVSDSTVDNSADDSNNSSVNKPADSEQKNPNTGDFASLIIVVAAVALIVTVLSKKRLANVN